MGDFSIHWDEHERPQRGFIRVKARPLNMLMVQLAANIIVLCSSLPRHIGRTEIGNILFSKMRWTSGEIANAIQKQVELLYAYVERVIETRGKPLEVLVEEKEAKLFAEALNAYQDWKNDALKPENVTEKSSCGTALGLFSKDWSDRNKALLALFGK